MKVNCLGCGHLLRLGEAYEDYHGCIKCNICHATMEIHSVEGKLKAVNLQGEPPVQLVKGREIEGKRRNEHVKGH